MKCTWSGCGHLGEVQHLDMPALLCRSHEQQYEAIRQRGNPPEMIAAAIVACLDQPPKAPKDTPLDTSGR